jgi:hypothetical protein
MYMYMCIHACIVHGIITCILSLFSLPSFPLSLQVLAAATVIAKHTSVLCNACKVASSKTSNPVAKKHFVQAAKEVANSTAGLVKNIKALAGDLSESNRQACAETTKPLIEAVEALTTFASSPQFASTPAKISAHAKRAQEPITLVREELHVHVACMYMYVNYVCLFNYYFLNIIIYKIFVEGFSHPIDAVNWCTFPRLISRTN